MEDEETPNIDHDFCFAEDYINLGAEKVWCNQMNVNKIKIYPRGF